MNSKTGLRVAIIGSGKIGTDLMIKTLRSPLLNCALFVGRSAHSAGLMKARDLGVSVSSASMEAIIDRHREIDLVFDATSAQDHLVHAPILKTFGIKAIDLTPAEVGSFSIPAISGPRLDTEDNLNMVTCGGQASVPIVHTLSEVFPHLTEVAVDSFLAEDSVGPATLANIDHYFETTQKALSYYSCFQSINVQLHIEKSSWKPDMLTSIRAPCNGYVDLNQLYIPLQRMLNEVRKYVPGYHIVGTPKINNHEIEILVSVRGQGDWIPSYAGNLDIINCAAIREAENYARHLGVRERPFYPERADTGAMIA